jgi:hypothetical protein
LHNKNSVVPRWGKLTFPASGAHRHAEALELWAVYVLEKAPPGEATPIEWCLLSSRPITSVAEAQQCLHDYALRRRIEDWHRVLKSGCKIEGLAHETVERLQRSLAINLVLAWRIMVMTLIGREAPQSPAELMFSEVEIEVLAAWAQRHRYPLKPPDTLGHATLIVAIMGGYLNRNSDPPPGHQLMWHGQHYLQALCIGYELRAS